MLTGKTVLLGVCGGIAAYKACELARMLVREHATVRTVLTPHAARFVAPLTFTALTGRQALAEEFAVGANPPPALAYAHLDLPRDADVFVIAPATANTLAKLAGGLADNLLTGAYLACTAPVVIAPAMNVRMWEHPATQANVRLLRDRGHRIVGPGSGELACGDEGGGRLAELDDIFNAVAEAALGSKNAPDSAETAAPRRELTGRRIIVTAGGTREYFDPVRFITNASSGALGAAMVNELARRGADVELLDTGIELPPGLGERLFARHEVRTAYDLLKVLSRRMAEADGLVMLAAVADYGPAQYLSGKRKKDGEAWTVQLVETPDVLATVAAQRRPGQVLMGVSLEDTDWLDRAVNKARAKHVDGMLAVELGADLPFGDADLRCALVDTDGVVEPGRRRGKDEAARLAVDWLSRRLAATAADGGSRSNQ